MNRILVRAAPKANAVAARLAKRRCLGCSSVMVGCIPRLCRIAQKPTLQAIIRGHVRADSIIYSDGWRGYDGLVDVGYGKHLKVAHAADEFVRGRVHINGIEGFWGYAKSRLAKFRGMRRHTFYLHLKECEFRFNYRSAGVYPTLLKLCRENPLKLS